jgi:hypothetical protein
MAEDNPKRRRGRPLDPLGYRTFFLLWFYIEARNQGRGDREARGMAVRRWRRTYPHIKASETELAKQVAVLRRGTRLVVTQDDIERVFQKSRIS